MTLVWLKLSLFSVDIAQRFSICVGYFSKIFTAWTIFLSKELRLIFPFPSSSKVTLHRPCQFDTYPNTRVVIDCFEKFVERPSVLKVNCATFSNYANHNTFKCIVGVSLASCVTSMSPLWTGCASGKHCGLVDLLDGDDVAADRGFNVLEILADAKVKLNIPPTVLSS